MFPAEKVFRPFFLVLWKIKNFKEQFITVHNVFDSYWASYKNIFLGPTRSMEAFSQKKAFFTTKSIFGHFFSRVTE